MRQLAVNLRALRAKRGISQVSLAQMSGVPQNRISLYEAGKKMPSVPTIAALVVALDCSFEDILGDPVGYLDKKAAKLVNTPTQPLSEIEKMLDIPVADRYPGT